MQMIRAFITNGEKVLIMQGLEMFWNDGEEAKHKHKQQQAAKAKVPTTNKASASQQLLELAASGQLWRLSRDQMSKFSCFMILIIVWSFQRGVN